MEASSSSSHFDAFASILRSYDSLRSAQGASTSSEDAVCLLDDDEGIALKFARVLEGILDGRLSPSATETSTEEEISSLSLEQSVWSLIHTLYSERLLPRFESSTPEHLLSLYPYTPPLTLIQHIISQDAELAEWQAIHAHLMKPMVGRSPFGVVERKEGYWAQTAGMVRRAKMSGGGAGVMGQPTNLVGSLDPDAISRPYGVRGGGELGAEDANHNLSLLPVLFSYLRYGRAEDCAALCRANDQSWRGASLVGGGSGWWIGGLAAKDTEHDDEDDDLDIDPQEEFEIGNRTRALWKKIGRSVASNTKLPVYERALYGTLTGYLPAVLPVCRSWEDHVWAHINARIEARIDRRLFELGGFWADEFGVAERGDGEAEGARGAGLEDVFQQVMKTDRDGVATAAKDPYRMAMMYVILGRTNELFFAFAQSLDGLKGQVSPDLYPPLLRFFAHFVIYLRLLHQDPPLEAANVILQAYLDVLEEEGKSELVAVYAASLGEQNGAESYARFLKAMDPRATREERRVALLRAKEHGLDLVEVAKLTVNMVMNETFMVMPGLSDPEPDVTDFSLRVAEGGPDWALIRSLEWLTVSEETYPEALIQANNLIRFFLAYGKVHAAKELLLLLPRQLYQFATTTTESGSKDEITSQANEYLEHLLLFEVLGVLTRCAELGATKPKANTLKIDQLDWLKSYTAKIDEAHRATVDLLESSWLQLDLEDSETIEDDRRATESARIRHIFIPELIFRLHALLYNSRETIPSNLQKTLELPNLVASETHKLYVEFISSAHNRLPTYLSLVRQATLEGLVDADLAKGVKGNQDPFRAGAAAVSAA